MKSLQILLLSFVIVNQARAQSLSWSQDFQANSFYNNVQFSQSDPEGNTYFAGLFSSNIHINGHHYVLDAYKSFGVFIIKLDKTGDYIWAKVIQGGKELKGLSIDETGNAVVTIYADADTLKFDDGSFHVPSWGTLHGKDVFLVKFSSSGIRQWVKCTAKPLNSPYGDGTYPNNTYTDTEGNIYNFGTYYVSMSIDSTVLYGADFVPNLYVAKFKPDGSLVWLKNLGNGVVYGDGMLHDGLLLFLYKRGIYTFTKLNEDGQITLDREFKRDSSKGPVCITAKGRYIYATAILYDRKDWINSWHKLLITKLDAQANMIWEKGLRAIDPGDYREEVPSVLFIQADKQDNLYIVGSGPHYWGYDRNFKASFENYLLNEGDRFIARLNPEGKTEWLLKFPRPTAPYVQTLTPISNANADVISIGGLLRQGETILVNKLYNRGTEEQNLGFMAQLDISSLPIIPPGNNPIVATKHEYTLMQPNRISMSNALSSADPTRFTIKALQTQTNKGKLIQENSILWYTPFTGKTGPDTLKFDICNIASTTCLQVTVVINIKDSLRILKSSSIVNPNLGLKMNLFDVISNPNEGNIRLEDQGIRMPVMGTIELQIDGSLKYRAYNNTGKDTLGIYITSYDPRFENDIPVSVYLNYEFDIRTDIITGIPDSPGAQRPQSINFAPNPVTTSATANLALQGCNRVTVEAIDVSGKRIPLRFATGIGTIRIQNDNLPPGYYIIVVNACEKVYVDKVIVL